MGVGNGAPMELAPFVIRWKSEAHLAFEQGDDVMKVTAALVLAGLFLSTTSVRAGPCSNAIAPTGQNQKQ